ncbi:hypothetical protein [Paraburkholderia terricola]|uniref:Uncharacterized protein n=1 Tax=Paraburkholderia terricola TaxID=169427 RepID=A0A1M6LHH8_9BURK|nr:MULTISPECIES: hypothetical protein [Paraburkholderia]SDN86693.1 hypothetical protein SAMN05192547_1005119 [Paraburkholderia sediminicola]SHJ70649.1 hypothetical protein SAMN05192548_1005120 [Paraburkholderia terricola]
MQTIYELSPEYKEAFDTVNKMRARIDELNQLEGVQRTALAEGPVKVQHAATPRELALKVMNGETADNSQRDEFEKMRTDHAKTKADMEILQRGVTPHHEAMLILRERVSSKRMKQEDVRRATEKVAKAALQMAAAQKEMANLCRDLTAAGFQDFSESMLFSVEPYVTVPDALEVYAKRITGVASA